MNEIDVTMPEEAWFDAQHRADIVTYRDTGAERRYVRRGGVLRPLVRVDKEGGQ